MGAARLSIPRRKAVEAAMVPGEPCKADTARWHQTLKNCFLPSDLEARTGRYFAFCNDKRPHSSPGAKTPDQMYCDNLPLTMAA